MDGNNGYGNNGYGYDSMNNGQAGYSQDPYQQPAYGQDMYQQADYSQPVYSQPDLQGFKREPVKCPGKEITGLILGINSLVWSVLGTSMGCLPVYGLMFSIIWGLFGIGFGIAAIILNKKVHEQAEEYTNKIEIAKKLSVAGIIVAAVGIVISIIVNVVLVAIYGVSLATMMSTYNNSTYTP